ncbi:MAG TPA: DUF3419 family protein [candidate division WOR-3 bacterium]|uniref:DUF3419 family protein n=1 Tax=candidate division WOR-3 bacterium TaxID=2052148 RepID=A0A9C9ENG1_UNCW3|nr:DUF3419 family protein [candidate division WOR-3 bacterium]
MSAMVYANCWEDADVLLKAAVPAKNGVYLSIVSAGDNTLSLLAKSPSLVLAVDKNPAQLASLELRSAAFRCLPYDEILRFLGIKPASSRVKDYMKIRRLLSDRSRRFWDEHLHFIQQGVIHIGRTEQNFRLFRKYILPLLLKKDECVYLLKEKSMARQREFCIRKIRRWQWRSTFKILFSNVCIRFLKLGRRSDFYKNLDRDVSRYVLERIEYGLTAIPVYNNPYLTYIFNGNFGDTLPFYLRRENFAVIRANLDRIRYYTGELSDALNTYKNFRFDTFNLSDIFEYMNGEQFKQNLKLIISRAKEKGRLIYWNTLVKRIGSEIFRNRLKKLKKVEESLLPAVRAFFYSSLNIEEVV